MNIYEKIGLQKVINASGRMTILGVSTLSKESIRAFEEGSSNFVVIEDLMNKAGEMISKYTGGEDTCITSSASAGIAISVASLISGEDQVIAENLHISGIKKREIIIQKGHVINYGAPIKTIIELGGGKLVEVGQSNHTSVENIRGSITENTVGLFYVKSHHSVQKGMLSLEKLIETGREYSLPVIVDAAAEEDLRTYVRLGADMVIYSGSKAIEGAASGFITGKKELIDNCKLQYKGIGRAMKVDKGIIMSLLKALEIYSQKDEEKINKENKRKAEILAEKLKSIENIETSVEKDEAGREIYRVEMRLSKNSAEEPEINAGELIRQLESGNPAIYTRNYYKDQGNIHFDMRSINEKEIDEICLRIKEIMENLYKNSAKKI